MRIGIVGAGPSGSFLAELLSTGGLGVTIFDHAMPREKPCGGGISLRCMQAFPFIAELAEKVPVTCIRIVSPGDREVVLHSRDPMYIFSRKTLDTWLLGRAVERGARFLNERVIGAEEGRDGWVLRTPTRSLSVDVVVGADGARSMVRALFGGRLSRRNYRVAVGGYIPKVESQEVLLKFLKDVPGYFWVMPRVGHVAVGVGTELGSASARHLSSLLDRCLQRYFKCKPANCVQRFVALSPWAGLAGDFLPQHATRRVALVGDAAMLVDPISGEGIFYALKSASLLATALLEGALSRYDSLLESELFPSLRGATSRYASFYDARYLNLLTALACRSSLIRAAVEKVAFGLSGYDSLPKL